VNLRVEVPAQPGDLGPDRSRALGDDLPRRRREIPRDGGYSRLENARFLRCDFGERISELVGVLELDTRHAGDCGRHDVGGIETPPEPDFERDAIHGRLGEEQQCRCGRGVEERRSRGVVFRAQRVDVGTDLRHRRGQPFVIDLAPVDPESLGPAFQVWRREGSDAKIRCTTDRFDEERRRALALRASDVDDSQPVVRISEPGEQAANRPDVETLIGHVWALLDVDQLLEIGGGLFEGANGSLLRKKEATPEVASFALPDPGRVIEPCSASTGGIP